MTTDTWHMTPDTWHIAHDTWHMTCDPWHVAHGGGWTFSQNFCSPALTVWDRKCLEDSERKDDLMNEWMNEIMTKVFKEQPGYTGSVNYILLNHLKSLVKREKKTICSMFS